ncbi:MAG TPA: M14 family metallopeptidase [Cyclobacteriaceae bacterium]|nr:M14 family metallopeptidase [Cyclobacteriaceae bacterium]
MHRILLLLVLAANTVVAQPTLQSPAEFLGYELGDRFTRHDRVVAYYRHVDEAMPNVQVTQYGETFEHRPLVYAIVASAENFQRLEQIRTDNLKRAGMIEGTPSANKVAIVWLSYNVHGNEANSMEASMKTLYELVNPANEKTKAFLKNTVVILDPCINPDGRDRYANFYNQFGNNPPNPSFDAKEHREPWPGGRTNHYYFDLNRDWAWQTQAESRARVSVYNQWLPHVHVDFHEQGYNNPYYFAPAAEPYHDIITPWQREFQTMIGKNNARYFDAQGWLYFTKEVFDLYYPSYGDTYPTYSGAIGMTYEQGGGGAGGLAITTREGDPLTLKDRLTHHFTAGISTVEVASLQASRVVDEFEKYYRDNMTNPAAPYKSYVIKAENNPDKINQLTRWMDIHGIRYGKSGAAKSPLRGYDYQTQTVTNVSLGAEDLIIPVHQPKSRFITAVFEPTSHLSDSATYDITAWNLMYSYNLKAFATTERLAVNKPFVTAQIENGSIPEAPYAYLFRYQGIQDAIFLAALLKQNIKVRSAQLAFVANGQSYEPGTLIVTRRNNESVIDFDQAVIKLAKAHGRKINTTNTGFVEKGKDFGSGYVNYLKAPRVAMLFGEQTASNNAGEIWHFFEQQLHYPITQIGPDYLRSIDLKKYDVLIVPEGNYRVFDDSMLDQLNTWINGGGRLVVLANALPSFAEKKGFALKGYASDSEKSEADKKIKEAREQDALMHYEDAQRKQLSESISGAIYKVVIDKSHPLAFGLDGAYFTLKTNELRYGYLENGWNVGILPAGVKPVQGFAGFSINKKMGKSLALGVEDKGQGNIVYIVDNPLFRSFWEGGKMVFANAVFMVGQ